MTFWCFTLWLISPEAPNHVAAALTITNRQNADHYIWGERCDGWRLLYVIDGRLNIELDSSRFHLAAGDAFEVSPMSQHRVWNETKEDVSFLVISAPTTR